MKKNIFKIAIDANRSRFEDEVVSKLISGQGAHDSVRMAIKEHPEAYRNYVLRACKEVVN